MKGKLFIVSAPSGAGKTSLAKALIEQIENVKMSVSHTTRARRAAEVDGQDYFFVSKAEFLQMVDDGVFLEYAEVYGNYYGTSRNSVEAMLEQGINVMLDIDWQGAQQVRMKKPSVTTIFISPPSKKELEQRLRGRGQDSDEIINDRMAQAQKECSHFQEFDYIIINDNFEQALTDLTTIVNNQRLKRSQQVMQHKALLDELTS